MLIGCREIDLDDFIDRLNGAANAAPLLIFMPENEKNPRLNGAGSYCFFA